MCRYCLVFKTIRRERFEQGSITLGCKSYAGAFGWLDREEWHQDTRELSSETAVMMSVRRELEDSWQSPLRVFDVWCKRYPPFSLSLNPATLFASPRTLPSAIRLAFWDAAWERSWGDPRCAHVGTWQRSRVKSGTSLQGGGRGRVGAPSDAVS